MKICVGLFFPLVVISIAACVSSYTNAGSDDLSQRQMSKIESGQSNGSIDAASNRRIPDVTFVCNHQALCRIKREEFRPRILENENEKPDDIHPRYISFQFLGEYGEQSENSKFEPEINVYPISEFRQSLSRSAAYVEEFDNKLKNLYRLTTEQPSSIGNKLPFLPFVDAKEEFVAHLKYISFRNGKGLFYLTQFNTEPSIINNEGLTYIFQGLTDDKEFYILATFPVRTKMLPDSYDAEEFEDYKLPFYFYEPKDAKKNELDYRKYISKVKETLESQKSDQFGPNLVFFENLLSSLEIKKKEVSH